MENCSKFRENIGNNEPEILLPKSTPNILENYPYDEIQVSLQHSLPKRLSSPSIKDKCSKSAILCDTLEQHAFMNNVINTKITCNNYETRYSFRSQKEATVRRSLEEISKDIKDIEDFLTVSEIIMRQDKENDSYFSCNYSTESLDKENKTPSPLKLRHVSIQKTPPITFKINSYRKHRNKLGSPKLLNSKLYFRNGRIGCVEAEKQISNIESTHALVKHILKYENEKPLVSPESVRRVLKSLQSNNKTEPKLIPYPITEKNKQKKMSESNQSAVNNDKIEDITIRIPEDEDNQSQSLVDQDEQDVQICYDELPDIPNDEKNYGAFVNSEFDEAIETSENVNINRVSSTGSLDSQGQKFLRDQVRHLVRRFTARANKVKSRLELPPTPSSSASSPSPPPSTIFLAKNSLLAVDKTKPLSISLKSSNKERLFEADTPRSSEWLCSTLCGSSNDEKTLDPQGKIYISWLCVVSLSFLYNAWVIPMRSTFPFQTKNNLNSWLISDFCADIIYLLDVVFFKHRIMYLFEGFWVKNKNLTRKNYMRKLQFKLDLLAMLPLELLYFKFGTSAVYLRFPRLFKIQSFWEVFKLLDRVISSPHIVRVGKTLTYMLYMIHLTACAYYAYSDYQGLGVNRWVFSGKGHPYVRCFAFATKTATSIGKNPKPEREGEYVFMTAAWLMGVFVFALLIGQIRDIISTATRSKNEYRQLEDETLEYMRRLNLAKEVQRRVKMWFKFTWDQQRTLDEANILDSLPINLKTDIAISVHIQTLSKVQLFADCEEALLRDLVLKLRAVTFLPGDYVCRKGEVGREMYIIKLGQVQVMGGPKSNMVLATLSESSVFGEISLLGINGADRRTADVRSKGYSNLFVLSKSDLNEVIAYYPNAQAILKKRARTLMRKNAAREREEARARSTLSADVVIGNPKTPETAPKLLQTVIQALPYESPAVMLIMRGSKRMRKKRQSTQMETIEDKENEEIAQQLKNNIIYKNNRSNSPDLLSSIQNELKNKLINLTDSEKALIISTSNNNSSNSSSQKENINIEFSNKDV